MHNENEFNSGQDTSSAVDKMPNKMPKKKEIKVSVAALALDVTPVLFYFLAMGNSSFSFLFLLSLLTPFLGIIMGIISLCLGKKRIGTLGVILAVIAIVLPIIFVFAIMLLFKTGTLTFM